MVQRLILRRPREEPSDRLKLLVVGKDDGALLDSADDGDLGRSLSDDHTLLRLARGIGQLLRIRVASVAGSWV